MSRMADKRRHPSTYPRTNPVSGIVTEASWQQTVKEAAEMLGMNPTTLGRRMKNHGLSWPTR